METSHWAVLISAAGLLVIVLERTFGGGNGLANRFAILKETVTADITKLRTDTSESNAKLRYELERRIDEYEDNYRVGLEAITANIHELQLAALKFRAEMAEGYIPKGGLDDVRRDMRDGLGKVDNAIQHLQDMIMWAQPQQGQAPLAKPHR